jgi:uncharacterized protein
VNGPEVNGPEVNGPEVNGGVVGADSDSASIREAATRVAAAGESRPRPAPDPVNLPMIRHWLQAMGDANPAYTDAEIAARSVHGGLVAPPAMAQVWTMRGLRPPDDADASDPLGAMTAVLDEAGFTSVVATNSEQEYYRYLRHGEQLTVRTSLDAVTGPKRTALGEGWFVTTRSTWYVDAEPVASMLFRVLKFRPVPAKALAGDVLRPAVSRDTEFFWAGTARHELRIQRCGECGVLRHPPGPTCLACGGAKPDYVVAAGTGEIYSYVVHHHPPVPGRQVPFVVALVQLPEGVRMVGELLDISPERVRIGMPVRTGFVQIDEELTLPAWREAEDEASLRESDRSDTPPEASALLAGAPSARRIAGAPSARRTAREAGKQSILPELVLDVTPTLVISTALSTRDFQDVHHDRDRAVRRGGKDIFLNILTTTGLVQRYVTDWAGPDALVRAIAIRLGVPCYAGDTLTFSGKAVHGDAGECVVEVVGRCGLGDHVTGTVRLDLAGGKQ